MNKNNKLAKNRKRLPFEGISDNDLSLKKDENHPYKLKEWSDKYWISKNLYHDLTIDDQIEKQRIKRNCTLVYLDSKNYDLVGYQLSPEEQLKEDENKEKVHKILNKLTKEEYNFFILLANKFSYRKIGKILNITHNTVKNKERVLFDKIKKISKFYF